MLKNRVALVTGATSTLGKAVAKMLLERQVTVVASYRTEEKWSELLAFVGELRNKLTGIKADVTDEQSVNNVIKRVIDEHGEVNILLNIVGAYAGGNDVANTDASQWDFMMNVNLRSVFLCSKAVLPYMIRQDYGRIVNISSSVAVINNRRAKSAAYSVSKAGVKVLTETMAEEFKKYDINVNCVMPSTIDTPSNRRNYPKADFSKWIDPEDIAEVILFLVSHASKAVSGASVPVFGKT